MTNSLEMNVKKLQACTIGQIAAIPLSQKTRMLVLMSENVRV